MYSEVAMRGWSNLPGKSQGTKRGTNDKHSIEMKQYSFQHNYFNTYYYSNIISNILDADFEVLGFIDSFFNDEEAVHHLAKPFEKESAFHAFIFHIIHKPAVFFRDRGKCCLCLKDLSGLLTSNTDRHYDHIVPLAQGGLNDVSNLQLLCSSCNLKKSKIDIVTSDYYDSWY